MDIINVHTILAQKMMKQAKNIALKALVFSKNMVVVVFVLSVSSFFRSLRLYIIKIPFYRHDSCNALRTTFDGWTLKINYIRYLS